MSRARPTSVRKPSSSRVARSPVRSQSPRSVSRGRLGLVPVAEHRDRTAHHDLAGLAVARCRASASVGPRDPPSARRAPRRGTPGARRCRPCARRRARRGSRGSRSRSGRSPASARRPCRSKARISSTGTAAPAPNTKRSERGRAAAARASSASCSAASCVGTAPKKLMRSLGDQLPGARGVEARLEEERGAGVERRQRQDVEPEGVEEGQDHEHAVLRRSARRRAAALRLL